MTNLSGYQHQHQHQHQHTLLIVEDEYNLGITLQQYFNAKGLKAEWAQNAEEARNHLIKIISQNPRQQVIILMDIGLPDGNGIELAKEFSKLYSNLLILFLSAQSDPQTRVEALELGGYDFITKPFALKELTLRLQRIFEQKTIVEKTIVEKMSIGPLKIFFDQFEVEDAFGNILTLTQKEIGILKLLISKKNCVVNRDEILEKIWGTDVYPTNRTVDNYIVKLRRWSETDSDKNLQIVSIRGVGYKVVIK
jgi:two-component system alkaline phosphatase synthesis response regulator PhoP